MKQYTATFGKALGKLATYSGEWLAGELLAKARGPPEQAAARPARRMPSAAANQGKGSGGALEAADLAVGQSVEYYSKVR